MSLAMCDFTPPCVMSPVPLDQVSLRWDGPAVGRKAMCYPALKTIFVDSAFWRATPSIDGRKMFFAHEWAHLEGARCEPCADRRGGELLRALGAVTPRDAGLALLSGIEHRDNVAAAAAAVEGFMGYGLDGTRTVTAYQKGAPYSLDVVEVAPGKWLAVEVADSFKALLANASAHGLAVTVEDAFRAWEEQARRRKLYEEGKGNPADKPGWSEHQRGRAVDLGFASVAARDQFVALAARHGWHQPHLGQGGHSNEPWHFEPGSRPGGGLVAGVGGLAVLAIAAAVLVP